MSEQDADGGLTIYIQNESPGKDKEANWLPCPKNSFFMVMRLYQPEDAKNNVSLKSPSFGTT